MARSCYATSTSNSFLATSRSQDQPRPTSRDAIPIQHLLNPDGIVESFPIRDTQTPSYLEEDEGTVGALEDCSEASRWSEDYDRNNVFVGSSIPDYDGINFDSFFGGFETLTFGSYPLNADLATIPSTGGLISSLALDLEPRAFEIRQILINTTASLATQYPENQSMGPEVYSAIELITHVELDHCLSLYFGNYHRHCPIVHRPSFEPAIVPIHLLISLAALGAMYSSDRRKVASWKSLLDIIEAYIFNCSGFREEYIGSINLAEAPDEDTLFYQFQMFQGAYLMIIAQYFSGNLAGRRRARRERYMRVLNIARAFGLPTAQHRNHTVPDEVSFQRWVRTECRIR
ncbi:uncharacterized protein A1O9_00430 [Exophiala aquamarina CBS 119918]|uniref:Xylanolytic transcriptional activator regulatory domain-containing protein n=1 Tax=Exophiala aquamarina CBS 119918 TaxID=1182545 RepID=A0A072PSZ2_9EURO|nr:uncharacterized protein A1O9_00430 [Exophiala aquamarina CBS 119918]KEF62458.1 hypothetical protein A1O9_00430 [Exophiala aquamarina CBS 119918]